MSVKESDYMKEERVIVARLEPSKENEYNEINGSEILVIVRLHKEEEKSMSKEANWQTLEKMNI